MFSFVYDLMCTCWSIIIDIQAQEFIQSTFLQTQSSIEVWNYISLHNYIFQHWRNCAKCVYICKRKRKKAYLIIVYNLTRHKKLVLINKMVIFLLKSAVWMLEMVFHRDKIKIFWWEVLIGVRECSLITL